VTVARDRSFAAVALPTDHGGWGFTLEPVLLGLLVAPSWAGAALGVAAFAAFLARRPVKLALVDRRRARRVARTGAAERYAVVFVALAAAGVAVATIGGDPALWWAIAAAAPLGLAQVFYDARSRSRSLPGEMAGSVAMGAAAAAIALAAGEPAGTAFGLWLVLAARTVPSVLLARAQVRRAKGWPHRSVPVLVTHAVSWVVVAVVAVAGPVPATALIGLGILGAAAAVALALPPVPARTVGWTQMVLGLVVVVSAAVGV
jgi:hypothetical protein